MWIFSVFIATKDLRDIYADCEMQILDNYFCIWLQFVSIIMRNPFIFRFNCLISKSYSKSLFYCVRLFYGSIIKWSFYYDRTFIPQTNSALNKCIRITWPASGFRSVLETKRLTNRENFQNFHPQIVISICQNIFQFTLMRFQ